MYIVFVVVAAVVVFAVAAAAVGRGDGLEEPFPDMERPYLPDGRVEPVDVDDVHFAVAFRGYRMDQVDSVLDRLSEELIRRDQHIARLERIVHTQTVQSATAYTPPRQSRLGFDQITRIEPLAAPPDSPEAAGAGGPAATAEQPAVPSVHDESKAEPGAEPDDETQEDRRT